MQPPVHQNVQTREITTRDHQTHMTQCIFTERLVVDVAPAGHMLSSARCSPVSQEHVAVLAWVPALVAMKCLLGLDGVDV